MVNELKTIGDFEALVLMASVRLGANAYGSRIHQQIVADANRECASGALYTTIDRLETKGFLSTRVGKPTAERGGRAKNYLQVTQTGKAALRLFYSSLQQLADGISDLTLASDVYKILCFQFPLALTTGEILSMLGKLGWRGLGGDQSTRALNAELKYLSDQALVINTIRNDERVWNAIPLVKGTVGDRRTEMISRGGFIEEDRGQGQ